MLELRQALDSATTAQVERLEALESGAELEAKTARKAEARLEDMQCNATAVAKETCDTDRARFEREVSRVERELKCASTFDCGRLSHALLRERELTEIHLRLERQWF